MDDLIYRQAVIDMLAAMQGRCTSKAALIQNSKIWQQIKDLPSAQPEITEDDVKEYCRKRCLIVVTSDFYDEMMSRWSSAQPEPSQVAREICTILENEQDMRVILKNAQPHWIPVTKRLPDKMGTYLVTLDYKEHGTGVMSLWFHNEEIGWDLRVADEVTAWMPLPEPYKGGAE